MRKPLQVIITGMFAVFLMVNGIALLAGIDTKIIENRSRAKLPNLNVSWAVHGLPSAELDSYLLDRLPFKPLAVKWHSEVKLALFRDSPSNKVVLGNDDWLFLADAVHGRPCESGAKMSLTLKYFREFEKATKAAGKRPIFLLSPTKASIYPEFLPAINRELFEHCARENLNTLLKYIRSEEHSAYIDLWSVFERKKSELLSLSADSWQEERLRYLYRPRDRHWSYETGYIQARELVETISPGSWDMHESDAIAGTYALSQAELPSRFLNVYLPEPYSLPNTEITEQWPFEKTTIHNGPGPADLHHYSGRNPSAIPMTVTIIHDSFINHSVPFLSGQFKNLYLAHRHMLTDNPEAVRTIVEKSDVLVLQVVEDARNSFQPSTDMIKRWLMGASH